MDILPLTLLIVGTHGVAVALGYLFGTRHGSAGNTVNLTVATNQSVEPPDPWKDVEIDDDEADDGEGWKHGKPNPLGPAG